MTWHGSSNTPAGKATLTGDQWAMLVKLAEDSEYWTTAHDFMKGSDGHDLSSLSVKQLDWYNNIEAGLNVEIDKETARKVFGNERPGETIKNFERISGFHYE